MLTIDLKYVLSQNMLASFLADFISFFLGIYVHHYPADSTSFGCK